MGYEQDPDRRIPLNYQPSRSPSIDRVPEAKCRRCGQKVRFGTDGNGVLVAQDPETLDRHPCKGA